MSDTFDNSAFGTNAFLAERITSRNNPFIVMCAGLLKKKNRDEERLFLAEGVKLSKEAFRFAHVSSVIISDEARVCDEIDEIISEAEKSGSRVVYVPDSVIGKVSSEKAPQGVICVVDFLDVHSETVYTERGERILALENIQDPGNLGSVIRTASAFGYERLVISGCADIYNPKTVRGAMGALFRMKITVVPALGDFIDTLKGSGRIVCGAALSSDSERLDKYSVSSDDVFIMGNEGRGLSPETISACDKKIIIPMFPGTQSLNIASASAVIMWEQSKGFGDGRSSL